MLIRVVQAPEPIVTPADVPGDHEGNDATVEALIAAATAKIDGPDGYLRRAIGPQTLELMIERATLGWSEPGEFRLPVPPLIAVEKIMSIGEDGQETEIDAFRVRGVGTDEGRVILREGWPVGAEEIRVTFRAGYDGDKTPVVPAHAKAAILLSVQNLMAGAEASGGERSFQIDGAFTESYNSPDQVQRTRNDTINGLLAPLRVFR